MAASLLAMVCGITAKSKKHETDRPELLQLRVELVALADELASLARDDAVAYDAVVEAARLRSDPPPSGGSEPYRSVLKHAAEVPLSTAGACARVLELSVRAASLGKKSASSDVLVAVLLAEAGLKGAVANVRINLIDLDEPSFVDSTGSRLTSLERNARKLTRDALDGLR